VYYNKRREKVVPYIDICEFNGRKVRRAIFMKCQWDFEELIEYFPPFPKWTGARRSPYGTLQAGL
jgi:hypothetical protein